MTAAPLLVLIGPAAAGKSTVGALVADRLGVPFVDLDAVAAPAHAVARVVAEHPGAVVALGAGHTSFTSTVHAHAVRAALAPVRAVVLLLPAEAPEEALAVLRARSLADKGTGWVRDGHDFLAGWVADPAVGALASHVVVTGDEPPGRTAERVARLVRPEG